MAGQPRPGGAAHPPAHTLPIDTLFPPATEFHLFAVEAAAGSRAAGLVFVALPCGRVRSTWQPGRSGRRHRYLGGAVTWPPGDPSAWLTHWEVGAGTRVPESGRPPPPSSRPALWAVGRGRVSHHAAPSPAPGGPGDYLGVVLARTPRPQTFCQQHPPGPHPQRCRNGAEGNKRGRLGFPGNVCTPKGAGQLRRNHTQGSRKKKFF